MTDRIQFASAGAVRKSRPPRDAERQNAEVLDFIRNVAGTSDDWLRTASADLLRATIKEFRTEARSIQDKIEEPR